MRVAVISGSLAAGMRIAAEIEPLPGIDLCIVSCNLKMRSPFLRWLREVAHALSSSRWQTYITKAWSYARSGKLVILDRPLDDPASVDRVSKLRCDVGLHTVNVIYRQATIEAFRLGILNAHIGILPGYRGRSVAEWSVLQGDPTGITVFFIDSGIDTGARIVLREFISAAGTTSVRALKTMLFGYDARLYRKALEALSSEEFNYDHNDVSNGKRYYVMSKLFSRMADTILGSGDVKSGPG
jgi:Formyl transferase